MALFAHLCKERRLHLLAFPLQGGQPVSSQDGCLGNMKPAPQQSTLAGLQRLAGALIGAILASIVVLTIDNQLALEIIALLLLIAGAAIRYVNYAWYCAAIAAGVLIAVDIPNPTNFAAEVVRVLFTFIGIGIGILVMYIATLLGKRAAKALPQPI